MKDEIKEILDIFISQYDSTINIDYIDSLGKKNELKDISREDLLDYITNLQEENERYKRIFEGKERFSKIMPDNTDFIILSKADYDRQQEDIELGLIDYKSRNEKAIEYIKEWCIDDEFYVNLTKKEKNIIEALNILQGEDKDE